MKLSSNIKKYYLLTIALLMGTWAMVGQNTIPQIERDALIAFYKSTDGDNWVNTKANNKPWKINDPTSDVSNWYGIEVSNGHVVMLGSHSSNAEDFKDNNIRGSIPPEIRNLTSLTRFVLDNLSYSPSSTSNKLIGSIPKEIGNLTNLKILTLSKIQLTGSIPIEIGNLTKLTNLDLDYNQLSGSIPTEIGNILGITFLRLSNNQLTGVIPASIANLKSLYSIQLRSNQLTGNIPLGIGSFTTLRDLDVSINKLTGGIPTELGNLKSLYNLAFYNNQLTGTIPTEIFNITSLNYLSLGANQLTGSIPVQLGNLINLVGLSLNNNQLTGSIPIEIGNLKNLQDLSLSGNKLTGSVPSVIGNLSKIRLLQLGDNQLIGSIPPAIGNLTLLNRFTINNNKFRFIDFATEFQGYKTKMSSYFNFSPQANINIPETITKAPGQSIDLKMYADGDTRYLADDTYLWFKNGSTTPIAGATSRILTLPSLTVADAGTYVCKSYHVTNPDMSPLVLEREPITLVVTNCTPTLGKIKFIPKQVASFTKTNTTTTKTNP
jgi:Leucine-rich repeat (LRR) protein